MVWIACRCRAKPRVSPVTPPSAAFSVPRQGSRVCDVDMPAPAPAPACGLVRVVRGETWLCLQLDEDIQDMCADAVMGAARRQHEWV